MASLLLMGSIGVACAQEAATVPRPESTRTKASQSEVLEEVVVTATGTNISGVKPVGSETLTLDQSDILATGATNIAAAVLTLPQVSHLGFSDASTPTGVGGSAATAGNANLAAGGNTTRGTALDLRGIGQNATLLLLDGRRVAPTGGASQFQDASQIPLAAVERVEVIADGASAIYGSDAVSGVVNYVLRKRFDGVELSGHFDTNKYGNSWGASGVGGHSWESLGSLDGGSFIVSYEHFHQSPILRGLIPQLRDDLTSLGGIDNRYSGSNASPGVSGNIVVPTSGSFNNPSGPINTALPIAGSYVYYGVPTTTDGHSVTAAQLALNQPNLVSRGNYEDYIPSSERDQVSLFANQNINDRVSIYDEAFFNHRESETATFVSNTVGAASGYNIQVNPGTPYYIANVPGAAGQPYIVQYNLWAHYAPNGGAFSNDTWDNTYVNTLGMKASLGREWNSEFYYTYGNDHNCGVCYLGSFVSNDTPLFIGAEVNAGRIDPYSTTPLSTQEIQRIDGSNIQKASNYIDDAMLKFDGPLFTLPGGSVRAAIGSEFTYVRNRLENGANRPCDITLTVTCITPDNLFRWDANADLARTQGSAFAELFVPVVGAGNAFAGVESLSVDAAVRYDHYSDFGSTTNPKLGVTWTVSQDLSLRGSWGKSFRAPGLQDLNPGVFSVVVQTFFPNTSGLGSVSNVFPGFTDALLRLGGNENLQPERGKTWSTGFDLTPRFTSLQAASTASPPLTIRRCNRSSRIFSTALRPCRIHATSGSCWTDAPSMLPLPCRTDWTSRSAIVSQPRWAISTWAAQSPGFSTTRSNCCPARSSITLLTVCSFLSA
jgi:iron complex outermembrane receptor protein